MAHPDRNSLPPAFDHEPLGSASIAQVHRATLAVWWRSNDNVPMSNRNCKAMSPIGNDFPKLCKRVYRSMIIPSFCELGQSF
mmetsp:Transcript_12761/g.26471  ORF Transcript_12761/g.26471 Transcript_12761/m.26471 type:complete len:82 (-) Transcript_12761:237-482(-)